MILEHALLQVKSGRSAEFETAFGLARQIISSMAGFRTLSLSRCLEHPDTYLLLVEWDSLDDHVEGFRKSPQYEQWRSLLHDFYDLFPTVEHYEQVDFAGRTTN
ncbi:antibiotic biosynthesis monooxygenase [Rhodococcus oryzae]|uniref:Antibiotic biosynthesis monooxygenase n=1 Tax=Rhodococcus oryzae TaxID=2571143 RepID=A0ABY2RKM1_9NOCA|nr:antibiotic biosynthesis monooxygenase [Rhodococcus oryzae]TJZ78061.1 antibiotic biosynthesis monooxygenase [Rhodococcus oryzae]